MYVPVRFVVDFDVGLFPLGAHKRGEDSESVEKSNEQRNANDGTLRDRQGGFIFNSSEGYCEAGRKISVPALRKALKSERISTQLGEAEQIKYDDRRAFRRPLG